MAAHIPECVCVRCEDGREWIAAQGLHVVSAADKAALLALDEVPVADLRTAIESPRTSHEIAEFARAALARAKEAPELQCCMDGHHSFGWRQGLEPCRYCRKPVEAPRG
jgi:hypothetical protein